MTGRAYSLMVETERVNQSESGDYGASVHRGGIRGRPSFDISKEQLLFFIEQGFKVKDISDPVRGYLCLFHHNRSVLVACKKL
jgi:hypothetical protein